MTVRRSFLMLALLPSLLAGQEASERQGEADSGAWRLMVRATVSSASRKSAPKSYEIGGGNVIEGAIARDVSDAFALELALRTESREVTGPAAESPTGPSLGSLELLPAALTLKWQPRRGGSGPLRPFAGAGAVVTIFWDQSGLLDFTRPPAQVDPVLQLGSHVMLSSTFMLTVDVKWHTLDVKLEGFALPTPQIDLDPLVFGAGFAFAF